MSDKIALDERFDGFSYDYRIRCACGAPVTLHAEAYKRESTRGAQTPCHSCGNSVHFGPKVAAIRDEHDPALDDARVIKLAWYHTSTAADWPSNSFRDTVIADAHDAAHLSGLTPQAYVDQFAGKALHLGTYEAALENMLRRVRDQGDGDAQFFLHRVGVNLPAGSINPGFRDENHEDASDLTVRELEEAQLRVVRYLNVWEAAGSLSLAIHPRAVHSVQTLPLPFGDFPSGDGIDMDLASEWEAAQAGVAIAPTAVAGVPHAELRMRQLSGRRDPDGSARRLGDAQRAAYDARRRLDAELSSRYLAGVSLVIAEDFVDASHHWTVANGGALIARFAAWAKLFTHGADVRAYVAARPARYPNADAH